MDYVHMQMPIDGLFHNITITGVPVTLTAIGSDSSVTDLGPVATNGYYGTFSKAWTPTKQDTYTIVASFGGDGSYGSSSAATAVSVGPAPEPIQFPQSPTPTDYTMTIVATGIAIIVAVAVIGLLLFLALRRRQ
jgi:hypothetical protein